MERTHVLTSNNSKCIPDYSRSSRLGCPDIRENASSICYLDMMSEDFVEAEVKFLTGAAPKMPAKNRVKSSVWMSFAVAEPNEKHADMKTI